MAPVTFYLPVLLSPIFGIALLIVSAIRTAALRGLVTPEPYSLDYTLRPDFDPKWAFVRMVAYRGMISAATLFARAEHRELT